MYDVVIVGAGPAGLSAALNAKKNNLNYIVLEREKIANTIHGYHEGKSLVVDYLEKADSLKGYLWYDNTTREDLIEKWNAIVKENKLNIKENEEVIDIEKNEGFRVKTTKNEYQAKKVILAIGKMSSPRKLGIKGEDQNNVLYRLSNSSLYNNKRILVIGGGNSAVEAALTLSKNNKVFLSYRKPSFFRLTDENTRLIKENKEIEIIFNSNLVEIEGNKAILKSEDETREIEVDFTFILIGFNFPRQFLEKLQIKIKDNKPVLDENYESKIKGLYLVGDISGKAKMQIVNAINQGYEVIDNIIKSLR